VFHDLYLPFLRVRGGHLTSEITAPAKQVSLGFQGAHRPANCMWLSVFRTHMTLVQYHAGNKQLSY